MSSSESLHTAPSAEELRAEFRAAIRDAVKHYDEGDVTDELLRALDVVIDAHVKEARVPAASGDVHTAVYDAFFAAIGHDAQEGVGIIEELTKRGVVVLGKADYDTIVKQRRRFAEVVSAVAAYVLFEGVQHEDPGCPEDDTCTCPLASRLNAALTNDVVFAASKLTTAGEQCPPT